MKHMHDNTFGLAGRPLWVCGLTTLTRPAFFLVGLGADPTGQTVIATPISIIVN